MSDLNKVLNQSIGDLNRAISMANTANLKAADLRPDWVKAAAYEMDFLRKELAMAKEHLKAIDERLDNVLKWATELAENLDKHVPRK